MKRFLLPFIVNFSFAAGPLIDGGTPVSLTSIEFVDVIEIQNEGDTQMNCTATRVKDNLILTAAHCVVDSDEGFKQLYSPGMNVSLMGSVKKVFVHPNYVPFGQNYSKSLGNKAAAELQKLYDKRAMHDLAFIEFVKTPSERTHPFPEIISSKSKLGERKAVNIAGYGATGMVWNGEKFDYEFAAMDLMTGENEWVTCPTPYLESGLQEIENISNDIYNLLKIKSSRTHILKDGQQDVEFDGRAMVLGGDSGSPALERDKNGKLIVTGVASYITKFDDGSGEARVKINYNGKQLENIVFAEFPVNWGQPDKPDTAFDEINVELKKHGLIDSNGNLKEGVEIERSYKRVTTGNFADLAHPENQAFIQSVMNQVE